MPDSRPEVEGRVETRTRLYLTPQHGFSLDGAAFSMNTLLTLLIP